MSNRPNPLIFALVCCYASASWLAANSIWVEMSVFTQHLPEGWKLGSVLDITIQAASLGPIIFILLDRCSHVPISHGILIQIALVVCILINLPLAFLWDKTVWLFGSNHSFVILAMAFIGGMVNVGSDVVFVPYMRNFEDVYLPAYFIGSGLSAVFPSLISIIQGASSYDCVFDSNANQTFPHYLKPNFSSTTFYLIMFAWSLLACFSFYLLNWHKKRIESWYPFIRLTVNSQDPITAQRQSKLLNIDASRQRDCLILLCLAILGIEINTILPSLLSYVTLPYSQTAYFWALILSALAQPIGGCFAYIFILRKTIQLIGLSGICLLFTLIFVVIATQSPNPPMRHSTIGSIFSVTLAVLMQLIGCFLRTVLLESYRDDRPEVKDRLFFAGLSLQGGSFIGTLIMYPMINFSKQIFKDAPPC